MRPFFILMLAIPLIACGGPRFTSADNSAGDGAVSLGDGGAPVAEAVGGCAATNGPLNERLYPFRPLNTPSCGGSDDPGSAGGESTSSAAGEAGSPNEGGSGGATVTGEGGEPSEGGSGGEPPILTTDDCFTTGLRFRIDPVGGQSVHGIDASFDGPGELSRSKVCVLDFDSNPQVYECCLASGYAVKPDTRVCLSVAFTNGSTSCDPVLNGCGPYAQYGIWSSGVKLVPETVTFPEGCTGQDCTHQLCVDIP